jgi:uncharacterized protein
MTVSPMLTAAWSPPVPVPSSLTAFFWHAVPRHELHILRCQNCAHYVHYPRAISTAASRWNCCPKRVSGRAQLYGYTWATQAFHPYFVDKLPYCSAVVELAEDAGVRMTTNIIDCPRDEVRTGMRVEVLFREVAPGLVLPLFRPDVSHVGSR